MQYIFRGVNSGTIHDYLFLVHMVIKNKVVCVRLLEHSMPYHRQMVPDSQWVNDYNPIISQMGRRWCHSAKVSTMEVTKNDLFNLCYYLIKFPRWCSCMCVGMYIHACTHINIDLPVYMGTLSYWSLVTGLFSRSFSVWRREACRCDSVSTALYVILFV